MRTYITTPNVTAPISQAVVAGPICWISGQLGVDASGQLQHGTTADEGRLAFANLFAVLASAGFTPEELVFIDIAVIDLADLGDVNALWEELFDPAHRPARTIAQAAALPLGARIKVYGVAVRA
jgi:2-iminobutanoate/2-iminopropanoate deaminase